MSRSGLGPSDLSRAGRITTGPGTLELGVIELGDGQARAAAVLFRALADPARVRIVNLLAASDGPVCACMFEPALGLTQATVSHHLKKLADAGLLDREQRGKWAFFSLNADGFERLAALVPRVR
jgi:ArsR family transcriptional regulator, arsenate/arsenite/antimonite-responsive transcriptional repressor